MLGAIGVCLALASGPAQPPHFVAVERFTLAWTHSIEKQRWEEDYELRDGAGGPRLHAVAARVRGSGAGMEPPADAVRRDGWYEYRPHLVEPGALRLTRSEFTPDFEWCAAGVACRPLSALLPSDGGVTLLSACRAPAG